MHRARAKGCRTVYALTEGDGYGHASPETTSRASGSTLAADIGAGQIDVLMKIRARTYRFDRAHYETLDRVHAVESAEIYTIRADGGPWARAQSAGMWGGRTDVTKVLRDQPGHQHAEDARFRKGPQRAIRETGLIDDVGGIKRATN